MFSVGLAREPASIPPTQLLGGEKLDLVVVVVPVASDAGRNDISRAGYAPPGQDDRLRSVRTSEHF